MSVVKLGWTKVVQLTGVLHAWYMADYGPVPLPARSRLGSYLYSCVGLQLASHVCIGGGLLHEAAQPLLLCGLKQAGSHKGPAATQAQQLSQKLRQ